MADEVPTTALNARIDEYLRMWDADKVPRELPSVLLRRAQAELLHLQGRLLKAESESPRDDGRREWCVFYGGTHPHDAAGRVIVEDEAEALESLQWLVGPAGIAYRTVEAGIWHIVGQKAPVARVVDTEWVETTDMQSKAPEGLLIADDDDEFLPGPQVSTLSARKAIEQAQDEQRRHHGSGG